jgi:uncharacterized protein YndB with AHSA1/START domain
MVPRSERTLAWVASGADELTLRIGRRLAAPRPTVIDAMANPTVLARWWGPAGFTVPRLDYRPAVGTSYRILMAPPQGDSFVLVGEFRQVELPARLVYTFAWEDPDPDDVETLVAMRFDAIESSTDLLVTHGLFRTPARLTLHRTGWNESLDKLEQLLAEPMTT